MKKKAIKYIIASMIIMFVLTTKINLNNDTYHTNEEHPEINNQKPHKI